MEEGRLPNRSRAQRASRPRREGRARAALLSLRLGTRLREARQLLGKTQREIAEAAGVSQSWLSRMERGQGASASLVVWSSAAAAVGQRLAAFLEDMPGADRPRDHAHLERQRLVIERAARGGWRALPEEPIDDGPRSRSVDVLLVRAAAREAALVECYDWFDDVGAAMRVSDGKAASLRSRLEHGRDLRAPAWRVALLWVVRGTRRNRELISEFRAIFAAKFGGSSSDWIRCLEDPSRAMPSETGLVWTDLAGHRFMPARLGRTIPSG